MPRIRTIKPEFWCDEKLSKLAPIDRLVFLGLIGMADDYGRLHDNAKVISAFIFPETDHCVRESLANLSRIGRVRRGVSAGGKRVLEIVNWQRHQRVDKPQKHLALPPIQVDETETQENQGENEIRESFANDSRGFCDVTRDLGPGIWDQGPGTREQSLVADRDRYSDDFARFWDVFPKLRRRKKQEAFRRWKQAVRRVDAETLIAKAEEYAASPVGQSEFVQMPTTWLGGGCWEDDPESWQRGDSMTAAQRREANTQAAGDRFVEELFGDG